MGPLVETIRFEIVGIAENFPRHWGRFLDPVAQAVFAGIGDGFVLGGEFQPYLAVHIARTRPSHQRIDLAWCCGSEDQDPKLGPGIA